MSQISKILQQSKNEKVILSFKDMIGKNDAARELLFPPLPDNYFEGKDMDQILQKPLNPIEKVVDKYNSLPVKPYIKRRNLNCDDEQAAEKAAWEIGISIDF